jgi:hypothetical protein
MTRCRTHDNETSEDCHANTEDSWGFGRSPDRRSIRRCAFIPCSLGFPRRKNWHLRADQDGDGVVRFQGKQYPVTLNRISPPTLDPKLEAIVTFKYGGAPSESDVWFFELNARES